MSGRGNEMKRFFGVIAMLASSAALVLPASAHDRDDDYAYRNNTGSYNQGSRYGQYEYGNRFGRSENRRYDQQGRDHRSQQKQVRVDQRSRRGYDRDWR